MSSKASRRRDWSRTFIVRPKDHLKTIAGQSKVRFIPSYERNCCPDSMALILGWEYARIWLREREEFIRKRESSVKTKSIKNDYGWWLKKHKVSKKGRRTW